MFCAVDLSVALLNRPGSWLSMNSSRASLVQWRLLEVEDIRRCRPKNRIARIGAQGRQILWIYVSLSLRLEKLISY